MHGLAPILMSQIISMAFCSIIPQNLFEMFMLFPYAETISTMQSFLHVVCNVTFLRLLCIFKLGYSFIIGVMMLIVVSALFVSSTHIL